MTTTTSDPAYQSATTNPSAQYSYATAHCTLTPYLEYAEPFSNGWTYKRIMEVAGGAAGVACLVLSGILIFTHLTVWVRPHEQKQIVRIIFFAPVFVIFNWLALHFYGAAWALTPIAELYECFALVSIFYLFVLYVSPNEDNRESFFDQLQAFEKKTKDPIGGGSLRWFQITWVSVFQILPTKLAISILQWALNAGMCPLKYADSKASTVISVLQSIVTAICVLAIIKFEKRLKQEMHGHHPMAKLVTFKGVVGLVLLQTPIFTGLAQHRVFHPTKYVSIIDFAVGTPSFLVCLEMFIVSLLFWWSFSSSEYRHFAKAQNVRRHGIFRGLFDSFNISDILKGCWYMVSIITGGALSNQGGGGSGPMKYDDAYEPNGYMKPPPAMATQYPPQQHHQGAYDGPRPPFQQ